MTTKTLLSAFRNKEISLDAVIDQLRQLNPGGSIISGEQQQALMLRHGWQELDDKAGQPGQNQLRILCGLSQSTLQFCQQQDKLHNRSHRYVSITSDAEQNERCFEDLALQLLVVLQQQFVEAEKSQSSALLLMIPERYSLYAQGLSALLKTACLENPGISAQVVIVAGPDEHWLAKLDTVVLSAPLVKINGEQLQVSKWQGLAHTQYKLASQPQNIIPWQNNEVYLISGGAGGIALQLVREIVTYAPQATLVLLGRSKLTAATEDQLKSISNNIHYYSLNISDVEALQQRVDGVIEQFGQLNGVIHCAGVIKDNYLLKKSPEQFGQVLQPKVQGVVALDKATTAVDLNFFVIFSSLAGVFGNSGQGDYAAANGFMDAFAEFRNNQLAAKPNSDLTNKRSGHTLSINWPLWADGGMSVDSVVEQAVHQQTGLSPMALDIGFGALYYALHEQVTQLMVLPGDIEKIRVQILGLSAGPTKINSATQATNNSLELENSLEPQEHSLEPQEHSLEPQNSIDPQLLNEKVLHRLKTLFSGVLLLPFERMDIHQRFERFGLESVAVLKINAELQNGYQGLSKTLLYQYETLASLTQYLCEHQLEQSAAWCGLASEVAQTTDEIKTPSIETNPINAQQAPAVASDSNGGSLQSFRRTHRPNKDSQNNSATSQQAHSKTLSKDRPIAIIGLAGIYPKADNLAEFWQNLQQGMDCISEIPAMRWPADLFFQPKTSAGVALGKYYCKWGGFVDSFAEFDPLFFNLAPREAYDMDPQERLFIQSCWWTMEDAGYTRERFARECNRMVGVFAGITKTGYALYGAQLWQNNDQTSPYTSFSSVANRVSYLLDLSGPSMPIDTMCSSSLTAIHEACEHLKRGECEMAFAGGVNLYLHPTNYISLCAQGMLSPTGRCSSFGEQGDGFVPGEGVGSVLLKPLDAAQRDNDGIYGVIRSTAINHDGHSNGYTVPSPTAQAALIRSALDKINMDATSINYVEAHGTGTSLGDPIEVTGLTQAFEVDTDRKQFCALGSLKSNIGHLEAAAGIAGLTKILLQMRHRKLVPSLHASITNPNIDFSQTPFVVQQQLTDYQPDNSQPMVSALSSFGAGGANAHAIIEEYQAAEQEQQPQQPALIILSAKTAKALTQQAQQLLDIADDFATLGLSNIAYTLQIGREAMDHRMAVIVADNSALVDKLTAFVAGRNDDKGSKSNGSNSPIEGLYLGHSKDHQDMLAVFGQDDDMTSLVEQWFAKARHSKLLQMWVKGLTLDWRKLYDSAHSPNCQPRIVHLPGYPFAKQVYWIDTSLPQQPQQPQQPLVSDKQASAPIAPVGKTAPYPLLKLAQIEALSNGEPVPGSENRAMDDLLGRVTWLQLSTLCEQGNEAQLRAKLHADHYLWLTTTLDALADLGYAEQQADGLALKAMKKDPSDQLSAGQIWQQWQDNKQQQISKNPAIAASLNLVESTLQSLPMIVTGQLPATDILFKSSSVDTVGGVYKGNSIADWYNNILGDALMAYIQSVDEYGTGLRILEIGSGTGGTSALLFERLRGCQDKIAEYCYTDISRAFLLHAEDNYCHDNPYIRCRLLNIEKPLSEQKLDLASYDVVVATNVLHATKDIHFTINNAKTALKPHGLLLINEICDWSLYAHLTFGFLKGWWLSEDQHIRIKGSPAIDPQGWRQILSEEGFVQVMFPAEHGHQGGQQIVVAQSDGLKKTAEHLAHNMPQPTTDTSIKDIGELLVSPHWQVLNGLERAPLESSASHLAGQKALLLSTDKASLAAINALHSHATQRLVTPQMTVEQLTTMIAQAESFDHLYWVLPNEGAQNLWDDSLLQGQQAGVLLGCRLIKAVLYAGYATHKLNWTVVTYASQAVTPAQQLQPLHSGIHGLMGSMAKELPKWQVRTLDLGCEDDWDNAAIDTLPLNTRGKPLALRKQQWYEQKLLTVRGTDQTPKAPYRQGGVYLVIGGAGHIGELWSEWVIKRYQAKIYWIGRRALNEDIEAKIQRLSSFGPTPVYLSGDAQDSDFLASAVHQIKQDNQHIHGVIHAAMDLTQDSLAEVSEQKFYDIFAIKIAVSLSIAKVFKHEDVDLIVFFSSLVALINNPGQSHYAAGCAFADAYAQALLQQWPQDKTRPLVKVMNWGFWDKSENTSSAGFQQLMDIGIGAIRPEQGFKALDALLSGPLHRSGFVYLTKPLLLEGASDSHQWQIEAGGGLSVVAKTAAIEHNQNPITPLQSNVATASDTIIRDQNSSVAHAESVNSAIIEQLAAALRINQDEISEEESFADYGLDSILGINFVKALNQQLSIELETTVIFDHSSVEQLSQFIVDNFAAPASASSGAPVSSAAPVVPAQPAATQSMTAQPISDHALEEHVRDVIVQQLALALRLEADAIVAQESFADYGLDSILGINFVNALKAQLAVDLETTVIFDHPSVDQLVDYLVHNYKTKLSSLISNHQSPINEIVQPLPEPVQAPAQVLTPPPLQVPGPVIITETVQPISVASAYQPVAVIGMAGRFAGSTNLDELWQHLINGDDLVSQVTRWDLKALFASAGLEDDCRYGSLIDNIDQFDPMFFNISGLEANYMDPKQRLFLEQCYHALEHAGYAGKSVQGMVCGVYVGNEPGDYNLLFDGPAPAQAMWGVASSILPARISYFLDLQGPAIAVDTACSSSLVAIHQACQALWSGEVEMALGGGASVEATPGAYLGPNTAGMLSVKGRCFTFDDRADGFVPGEGIGVVVLKRLADAQRDNDYIHGVIRGSGLNQDGTSNGITAPSARSQERLLTQVYKRFGINPAHITMVEAHGTGTELGDPIEFNALVRAFGKQLDKQEYCAIGSIKTNLGHTKAAAGVAGVLKVLLSLRHQQIPPTLHYVNTNVNIKPQGSPFRVNTELVDWQPMTTQQGEVIPRIGVVSAFGMSGTNAHMVIEQPPEPVVKPGSLPVYLIVLSAMSEAQLKTQVQQLASHCQQQPALALKDISFTLFNGRRHLHHRLACVADNVATLVNRLQLWLEQQQAPQVFYSDQQSSLNKQKAMLQRFGNQSIVQYGSETNAGVSNELLASIADLFIHGIRLDYARLFTGLNCSRVPLPTYPFAKESYWAVTATKEETATTTANVATSQLHPLLHGNISDFSGQQFSSVFTGNEFFFTDHVINGNKILPGAAHLEMALAALQHSLPPTQRQGVALSLQNVVWVRPIAIQAAQPKAVAIRFETREDNQLAYAITTGSAEETVTNSQGMAAIAVDLAVGLTDELASIQARCTGSVISKEQHYQLFSSIGIDYGPQHQCVTELALGDGELLARLELDGLTSDYAMHPGMLDCALQATMGLFLGPDATANFKPHLPYALDELTLFKPLPANVWASIRWHQADEVTASIKKMDIDLLDDEGKLLARLRGYTSRALSTNPNSAPQKSISKDTLLFKPHWQPLTGDLQPVPSHYQRYLLTVGLEQTFADALGQKMPAIDLTVIEHNLPFEQVAAALLTRFKQIMGAKSQHPALVQLLVDSRYPGANGLYALLRTVRSENPQILGQLIQSDFSTDQVTDSGAIARVIDKPWQQGFQQWVRLSGQQQQYHCWQELEEPQLPEPQSSPFKNDGVYLVTGGLGGLGFLFAKEIASQVGKVNLMLAGRSALNSTTEQKIAALEALGASVNYEPLDIASEQAVEGWVNKTLQQFGEINGIFHSAGMVKDNFILKKQLNELAQVMAPKVAGVLALDKATAQLPLDMFVVFSSISASLGGAGQSDYAMANGFMDGFCHHRQALVASGQRFGQSLSINWPFWREGGMQLGSHSNDEANQALGISAMDNDAGLKAFYQAFWCAEPQVMVFNGKAPMLRQIVANIDYCEQLKTAVVTQVTDSAALGEQATDFLKQLVAGVLKLPVHRIDANAPMENYGIDSILVVELTNALEKEFGLLSKTLFFEYQNIAQLSEYFVNAHADVLNRLLAAPATTSETDSEADTEIIAEPNHSGESNPRAKPTTNTIALGRQPTALTSIQSHSIEQPPQPAIEREVAIIGIAGRYAKAQDIEQFWDNLRRGEDCVGPIPKWRWDSDEQKAIAEAVAGKRYCQWGGFIDGVENFDPLFFGISPREAFVLDPQERLFLQCAYSAIEQAGYTRQQLKQQFGGKVGVYVGVMYEEYPFLGVQAQLAGQAVATSGSPASIANRVSYFCNFNGPSLAVDSMCSSSLATIHLACQSLQQRECALALAGGVNISIHPNKYMLLSQGQFSASNGRCVSFGEGGDGYVPGEGVGAILLKLLSRAIDDGDQIHGVIKGSAINHGGKTNGYSVPNPNAQADVVSDALSAAKVDPATISYVEAHGTGTSLGDPIEITGLEKAFAKAQLAVGSCPIGSVKSNIGHCESAAGIAALTKVILQMKHGQIVPSLHSARLNPNIQFDKSPFVVQQQLTDWQPASTQVNGRTVTHPRRAGISSFGAGGANAHVIVEQYISNRHDDKIADNIDKSCIVLFSTKTQAQLVTLAGKMIAKINAGDYHDQDLPSIAATTQLGREAMNARLAIVADSIEQLKQGLMDFAASKQNPNVSNGELSNDDDGISRLAQQPGLQQMLDKWLGDGQLLLLAQSWSKGIDIQWAKLYTTQCCVPHRIDLPLYPFLQQPLWLVPPEVGVRAQKEPTVETEIKQNTGELVILAPPSSVSANVSASENKIEATTIARPQTKVSLTPIRMFDENNLPSNNKV